MVSIFFTASVEITIFSKNTNNIHWKEKSVYTLNYELILPVLLSFEISWNRNDQVIWEGNVFFFFFFS